MYKTLPTITESAQELQQQFRAEKAPQKRQRLQALYLLASGQARSRLAVAELLAVHRHTVRAWLALYEEGGLRALLTLKKAPGKRSTLTPAVVTKLQARLRQPHGFGSYREIQQYLASEHHVVLAYSTVHGVVRYQLQAKPKSPRRAHPKKSLRPSSTSRRPSTPSSKPV
jgi:transposase